MRWLILVVLLSSHALAQESDWLTYYEKSNYKKTPRYDETIAYCKRLAQASPWLHFTTFGKSTQGRDLPLVIADRAGQFDSELVRATDRVVLLIQAGIHSGEIDGKDAGLMLLRDIAITKPLSNLLDHLTLLFIPIFNVDGHERFSPYNRINQNGPEEMGWRVTAQNLNLNRDYMKADAPEMQAWIRLFVDWLPDFFIDCHVTDGADYQYVVTYGLEIFGSMAPGLTEWTRNVYLKYMEDEMMKAGFPISPYVSFRRWHDPRSGIASWSASPRLSEGYTAIQNRPGLLIETHMLKNYQTRVTGTYEMLKHTMILLNRQHKLLRQVVQKADLYTASAGFRHKPFTVQFKTAKDSVMTEFLGVDYKKVKSDLTGGTWIKYGSKPVTYKIPFFNQQEPAVQVALPEAYIIPPEWTNIIARLQLHGVQLKQLVKPATISVNSYRFSHAQWQQRPFEGRHTLRFKSTEIEEVRTYPSGSVLIDMNQRAARVAVHILEPEAPDSYLHWGFFDTIFEQKEYAESYVMEELARRMLDEDENLKKEFEQKKTQDAEFAKNPRAILNWFYSQSPYWDKRINVYPVGKLFERAVLNSLEFRPGN